MTPGYKPSMKKLWKIARGSPRTDAGWARRGFTMLELAVSLSLTAFMVAPLGAILWQLTVVPTDTVASLAVESQVRTVDIDISDDLRSAQGVTTGDAPVWAAAETTDFTSGSGDHLGLGYLWTGSSDGTMLRVATVNGAAGPSFNLGRFFDNFDDARIGYRSDLPPYLADTSVTAELETPFGSQIRTGGMLSFLRSPAAPSAAAGGYAVFSIDELEVSGNHNAIIGNVHANSAVVTSCLGTNIIGAADGGQGVILRPAECYYLHNLPTPPSCDSPSYYNGFFDLWAENKDADGITTDGFSLWVVDNRDQRVFEYTLQGDPVKDFHLHLDNKDPRGIATDGSSFWVVDKSDKQVYRYNQFGNFTDVFDLTEPNEDARGITTDGSFIYVADHDEDSVYRYDPAGNLVGAFSLANDNDHASGIGTDGSFIWVVGHDDDEVFKYSMGGGFQGSFDLSAADKDPRGLATDGTTIWVADHSDQAVYLYDLSGNTLGQLELKTSNKDPEGIARTATSTVVVGRQKDKLYTYDLSGCSTSESPLAADNKDPRGVTTDGSSF